LVEAFEANVPGLFRLFDVGASCVLVALSDRVVHVSQRQAHFGQAVGVHGDLVLLEFAAKRTEFHDSRYAAELTLDLPVVNAS
jgi:hypothetical protein